MERRLHILLTCVGRRVELVQAFRAAAAKLEIKVIVHGADLSMYAPAMHHVDAPHLLPPLRDPTYVQALTELVAGEGIEVLVPTIDSELLIVSKNQVALGAHGCTAVISTPEVIQTCRDKLLTFRCLKAARIDTPQTWSADEALFRKRHRFPYFLKPRMGSAGKGAYKITSVEDLGALARRVPDAIVQEFVEGEEHTLDVYTGLDGVVRCVVPRKRLEVRAGEVSKGVVVKNRNIMAVGRRVARALGGCRGVVTVQCIVTADECIRVIEINPRFGGGAPLGIAAGADSPMWLMAEHLGRPVDIDPVGFSDGLVMLRYDQSVFRDAAEL